MAWQLGCPCGDGLARERIGWAVQETVASQLHTLASLSWVSPFALWVGCSALSQRAACLQICQTIRPRQS